MNLKQVSKVILTSATQTITLDGIDSNNVYMLALNNVHVGANGGICDMQPTTGGSPDTTNNISIAWTLVRANNSYQNFGNATQDIFRFTDGMAIAPNSLNAIAYLYNWYDSNEYSYVNIQPAYSYDGEGVRAHIQSGVKREQTSHDGVYINTNQSGGGGFQPESQFVLYEVTT